MVGAQGSTGGSIIPRRGPTFWVLPFGVDQGTPFLPMPGLGQRAGRLTNPPETPGGGIRAPIGGRAAGNQLQPPDIVDG